MIEEFKSEEISFPFKEIKNDIEMRDFLLSQTEEFKFLSIHFKADIDLHSVLSKYPIEGISLLKKPEQEGKPNILKQLNPSLNISYIQFNKKVSFIGCEFHIPVEISKVDFQLGLDIRHSNFHKNLEIFDTVSRGHSTLGLKSGGSLIIMRSLFEKINDFYSGVEIENLFHIEGTVIKSGLNLSRSKIKGQLNINNSKLQGSLIICGASIGALNLGHRTKNLEVNMDIQGLDISDAEFLGQVQVYNVNINGVLNAHRATFNELSFFTKVNFFDNVYFSEAAFHKSMHLEFSSAKKIFSFSNSTINSQMYFHEIDLSCANVYFTGTQINANLWLGNLLHKEPVIFNGKLSFQGASISSTSIVRLFNINNKKSLVGELDFSNSLIKGFLDIRNVYVREVSFDGALVLGNIQDNNTLLRAIKDRNTARVLKHEAKRINNTISSLNYNKMEMKLHSKTLELRSFSDWSILRLNYISNNYGADWIWGSLFTITMGLVFYSIFNMCVYGFGVPWNDHFNFLLNDKDFWIGFINYFWLPTGFGELTKNDELAGGWGGAISFILGKILIAYGIYQTIAAFRKYI